VTVRTVALAGGAALALAAAEAECAFDLVGECLDLRGGAIGAAVIAPALSFMPSWRDERWNAVTRAGTSVRWITPHSS
jgi:hypothetical protein